MHEKYMTIALGEAKMALQKGDFPVGCVIADSKGEICRGRRENSTSNNELDHAEVNALRRLYQEYPQKYFEGLTVYCTMEPCLMCYSTLILNNIKTIVYAYEDVMGGGTGLELERLNPLYASMKIDVIPNVLRQESVHLFKQFFHDERNAYWKDSLLAEYTLKQ